MAGAINALRHLIVTPNVVITKHTHEGVAVMLAQNTTRWSERLMPRDLVCLHLVVRPAATFGAETLYGNTGRRQG